MPIYTKNGDYGDTDLYGGVRVRKSVDTVEVLGQLDELNAFLGLTRLRLDAKTSTKISDIQNDLLTLGSVIAGAKIKAFNKSYIKKRTTWMESEIEIMEALLPRLRNFILPNGGESSARLHLARAICRRCERALVALEEYSEIIPYLNRLSDYLFVLARYQNFLEGIEDEKVTSNQQ